MGRQHRSRRPEGARLVHQPYSEIGSRANGASLPLSVAIPPQLCIRFCIGLFLLLTRSFHHLMPPTRPRLGSTGCGRHWCWPFSILPPPCSSFPALQLSSPPCHPRQTRPRSTPALTAHNLSTVGPSRDYQSEGVWRCSNSSSGCLSLAQAASEMQPSCRRRGSMRLVLMRPFTSPNALFQ